MIDYQALALPKPEPRKTAKVCGVCGGPIVSRFAVITCSKKCGYEYRKLRTRKPKACETCSVSFFPGGYRGNTRFCSRKCYFAFVAKRPQFIEKECDLCGSRFRRTVAAIKRVKRSFCSRKCCKEFSIGANNAQFRGDKDANRGGEWNRIAASIRKRDGYACKRCGLSEQENKQKLSVDHIRPWRSFTNKSEANDPRNLVALCRGCHSFKTNTVESAWLRGDVIAWKQWVASLSMPSAARFGMMA